MYYGQAVAACLVALASGCGGCVSREEKRSSDRSMIELPAGKEAEGADGSISAPQPSPEGPLPGMRWSRLIGQADAANRYPATVSLVATALPEQPRYRECSGVLLATNLVLTAGHCVCAPSRGESIRFDASECAATASVSTYTYQPPTSEHGAEGRSTQQTGSVQVHPRFQIVLDAQGAVVTSHADLAIIHLRQPVPPDIQPVRLATEEVKVGEVLTVVGYGYIEDVGGLDGRRRFSREKVQTPADGERLLFGSPELAGYKGDTGGPCLRETEQGLEVAGISQRGLGLAPAFTRIAPYREWLEEQIRLATR